jgi:hypothetical protein
MCYPFGVAPFARAPRLFQGRIGARMQKCINEPTEPAQNRWGSVGKCKNKATFTAELLHFSRVPRIWRSGLWTISMTEILQKQTHFEHRKKWC